MSSKNISRSLETVTVPSVHAGLKGQHEKNSGVTSPRCTALHLAVLAYIALIPSLAHANCVTSGNTTTCDTTSPSPWTSMIGSGPSTASGATVTVGANAQVVVGDASAIALGDNANITIQSGALVENNAVSSKGTYGTGANTIDFGNNSTLTVAQGATVLSNGTEGDAEAINPEGSGNTIVNNGTIKGVNVAAIWFQNLTGTNTVINSATGIIEAPGNNGSGDVLGASGNGSVDFTNQGQVIGNLVFAGGDDALHMYTGSSISGSIDGGGGSNLLTLNGTGSGTLPSTITNFQTLQKQDSGTWTVASSLSAMGITSTEVQAGTLALTGDNTQYTGQMLVDQGGTLQGSVQTLPATITDNGLVQFAQSIDGTYTGLISGTGSVEKDGTGTLTLAPSTSGGNTYTGGTVLEQGVLSVSADNALGDTSGGITFDGGTLQFGSSFNLASTRAISIADGGGTIDTQDFQTTITQDISGTGVLTKVGSGVLVLDGSNTWSGGTTVSAGTLVVGDASTPGASIASATDIASGATLGGYGSINGNVTNEGTLAVANALSLFANSTKGSFTIQGSMVNAGLIQLGAGESVGNTLNVSSYVGQNATIALNAVLAGDDSAADKLVVNGGTATGSTTLKVTNVGGQGAAITSNGILLVDAINGATTSNDAFTLSGGTIKAGAYEYYLTKGGVTAGTSQDWFLRNTLIATPSSGSSGTTGSTGTGTSGSTSSGATTTTTTTTTTTATTGTDTSTSPSVGKVITLYRPEAALYAEAPSVARELGVMQVQDFHLRQGDQSLLTENGDLPAAWGRVWGDHSVLSQGGTVSPSFDGTLSGAQVGQDLYADTGTNGQRDHYGLFVDFARASGDVNGFAVGVRNAAVGQLALNAYSVGGYWSHIGPSGWYTDTVVTGSSLAFNPTSRDGVAASTHGSMASASFESGLPWSIGHGLVLEPQAQVIWQHVSLNDLDDGISNVSFSDGNSLTGRVGVRLVGTYQAASMTWQPYVRLNLLRMLGGNDTATFGGLTPVATPSRQSTGQIDAGVMAKLSKRASIYAAVVYAANLGGEHQRTVGGNFGVRWAW